MDLVGQKPLFVQVLSVQCHSFEAVDLVVVVVFAVEYYVLFVDLAAFELIQFVMNLTLVVSSESSFVVTVIAEAFDD